MSLALDLSPPARQPSHYEVGQSFCANRCPRASRSEPGHVAGHPAADGHRGGGLHSLALRAWASAGAFLARLSLLPRSRLSSRSPCSDFPGRPFPGGNITCSRIDPFPAWLRIWARPRRSFYYCNAIAPGASSPCFTPWAAQLHNRSRVARCTSPDSRGLP